jgi:hypothetical protein
VLRGIRRARRDLFKVHLKATAPHSDDPRQLPLAPIMPPPTAAPWPEHQVDLEKYIAALEVES